MSLGKRLLTTGAASSSNLSETTDIFGDSSGIALYQLDYDGSTSPDASTSYDGTSSNVEFGHDGYINWGARFNGSSSKIVNSSFSQPTGDLSVSLWIKFNTIPSGQKEFLDWLGGGTQGTLRLNTYNSNNLRFAYGSGTSRYIGDDSYTISTEIWYHIVLVIDGSTAKPYFQNNALTTFSHSGTQTGTGLFLGCNSDANRFSDCTIDQVRVFNKALNSTEVSTLYGETAISHTGTTDTQDYIATNLAYYQLDSSADDAHSGTYNGTESNITYEFGRYGAAAVFSGSTSYIDLPVNSSLTKNNDFTWSMWFNLTSTTLNDNQVLFSNNSTSTSKYFLMLNNSTLGSIRFYGQGLTDERSASGLVTAGKWFHLVVTKSSTDGLIVYLDNVAVITETGHTGSYAIGSQSNSKNVLGGYYVLSSFMFPLLGSIDQVRIFDSALSSSQVTQLYQEQQVLITKNGSNPFGDSSEVAYYKFEDNASDSTGSYNGTTQGSPTYVTGLFNKAISFSNSDTDYINTGIAWNSVLGTSFSISHWVYFTQNPSSGDYYAISGGYSTDGTNPQSWIFYLSDGGALTFFSNLTSGSVSFSGGTLVLNQWNHVAFSVYDQTKIVVYLNGVGTTQSVSYSLNSNSANIALGNLGPYYHASGRTMYGLMDSVRIFNRSLEGDEVFKLYAEVIN